MYDVRLTATNPADSSVVPVACNDKGELLVADPTGGGIQLPPDPFEGAILGWQNGGLAWFGDVVDLPEHTYGPFTYDPSGFLVVPQTVDIPSLTALKMTDSSGNDATYQPVSDSIVSVGNADMPFLQDFVSPMTNAFPNDNELELCFDGDDDTFGRVNNGVKVAVGTYKARFNVPVPILTGQTLEIKLNMFTGQVYQAGRHGMKFVGTGESNLYSTRAPDDFNQENGTNTQPKIRTFTATEDTEFIGIDYTMAYTGTEISNPLADIHYIKVDGQYLRLNTNLQLSLSGATDLAYFQPGDVVQGTAGNADAVKIISIDDTVPSITVDGGDWDPAGIDGQQRVTGPEKQGSGEVSQSVGKSIILRSDNQQWVNGFYVTVPAQRIARVVRKEQTLAET